jgi:hypothetical protein
MTALREVLRTVTRDPEYHWLRREFSRLLDLHSTEESLPIDKIEGSDDKVCMSAYLDIL